MTTQVNIAIVMGSQSDWSIMKIASELLDSFSTPHSSDIVSAHRTPEKLSEFARNAASNGLQVIIAGAGGAAHLPGMIAAHTHLPVLGVPVPSQHLNGMDSLLSIAQMPKGVAVGTLAIGQSGAYNAALLAVQILSLSNPELRKKLQAFREHQTEKVLNNPNPKQA